MTTIHSLLLTAAAGLAVSACVVADYPGRPQGGSVSASYGVYDVLPSTYSGEAYRYQNRYYYGGRYEQGVFHDHGRQYNDRYYHAGRYYYGGSHEQHQNRPQGSGYNNRDHDHRQRYGR